MTNAPGNIKDGGSLTTDGTNIYLAARQQHRTTSIATTSPPTPGRPWRRCRSTSAGAAACLPRRLHLRPERQQQEDLLPLQRRRQQLDDSGRRRTQPAPGNVAAGGALTTDGTYLYAFQGKTNAFWRYDLAADTWTTLAPFAATTDQGGALVFVPGVNPQGRFTSSDRLPLAGRHRRRAQGHRPVRFEHSGQQHRRGPADRDADGRRLVLHLDRPDAHERRRRRRERRRRRHLQVDVHGRGGRHSRLASPSATAR